MGFWQWMLVVIGGIGLVGIGLMVWSERNKTPEEREAERKGYFQKRTPPKVSSGDYHYENVSTMPGPPSDPPENSGSDPPPAAP